METTLILLKMTSKTTKISKRNQVLMMKSLFKSYNPMVRPRRNMVAHITRDVVKRDAQNALSSFLVEFVMTKLNITMNGISKRHINWIALQSKRLGAMSVNMCRSRRRIVKSAILSLLGISVVYVAFLMMILKRKKYSIVKVVGSVDVADVISHSTVKNANAVLTINIKMIIPVFRWSQIAPSVCKICMTPVWMLQYPNVVMVCIWNACNNTWRLKLAVPYARNLS